MLVKSSAKKWKSRVGIITKSLKIFDKVLVGLPEMGIGNAGGGGDIERQGELARWVGWHSESEWCWWWMWAVKVWEKEWRAWHETFWVCKKRRHVEALGSGRIGCHYSIFYSGRDETTEACYDFALKVYIDLQVHPSITKTLIIYPWVLIE